MNMDTRDAWLTDPGRVVVEGGVPSKIIAWLPDQDPETWHSVAMT